jgi:hypothetical protein
MAKSNRHAMTQGRPPVRVCNLGLLGAVGSVKQIQGHPADDVDARSNAKRPA